MKSALEAYRAELAAWEAHVASPRWFDGPSQRHMFSDAALAAASAAGLLIDGTTLNPAWLGAFASAATYDGHLVPDETWSGRRVPSDRAPACVIEAHRHGDRVAYHGGGRLWWTDTHGGVSMVSALSIERLVTIAERSRIRPALDGYSASYAADSREMICVVHTTPDVVEYPHRIGQDSVDAMRPHAQTLMTRGAPDEVTALWLLAVVADGHECRMLAQPVQHGNLPPQMAAEAPDALVDDSDRYQVIPGHFESGFYYLWLWDLGRGWTAARVDVSMAVAAAADWAADTAVVRHGKVSESHREDVLPEPEIPEVSRWYGWGLDRPRHDCE